MGSRWSTLGRVAVVATAAAATFVGTALPGQALSNVTTDRLAGANRYATAAAVANAAYPDGADTVLIASGTSFADALSGSALAGRQGAPVLLTDPASLSPETSAAIDDLEADNAVILGGTAAVSQAVETALAAKATVTRIAGADRYDTAARIAAAIGAANIGQTSSRRTALIATGLNFADALAGGGLAAAGAGGQLPVLLVDGNGVPDTTEQALRSLGITQTIILGGTSAVSAATASELQTITGNVPTRLAGADRFATAAAIASAELASFGFSGARVLLANGIVPADALTGGPLAGKLKVPVLLTTASPLASATSSWLADHTDTVGQVTALGGTAALAETTLQAAKAAAQGEEAARANEELTVTPQDDALLAADGTRTYTVAGLGTTAVDVAIVPCEDVETDEDSGDTEFTDANDNDVADRTGQTGDDSASTTARISSRNGAPNTSQNNDHADDVTPANGSITFVVTGPGAGGTECVVPVVYADANSNDALDIDEEDFGTGGRAEFGPATAQSGSFEDLTVSSSSDAADRFVACSNNVTCSTFLYDEGDRFQIGGQSESLEDFEEALTEGDEVSGTYTPGGQSTFNISDDNAPAPPGIVTASDAANGINVSFTDSSTDDTDSYIVERAPQTGLTCGTFAQVGTVQDTGSPQTYTYNDTSAANGSTYCYRVRAVADGAAGDPNALPATATANA